VLKKLNFYFFKFFTIFSKMLLTELLKLFENTFNISEDRFISIVESNNIKLSQRLLSEIKVEKKSDANNCVSNSNKNIIVNNEDVNLETTSKKEKPVRGRGRPRKSEGKEEEETVIVDVERIMIGENEYYKTKESVILNKELEIEGILRDGEIVSYDFQ
jgi:hypothetical protein